MLLLPRLGTNLPAFPQGRDGRPCTTRCREHPPGKAAAREEPWEQEVKGRDAARTTWVARLSSSFLNRSDQDLGTSSICHKPPGSSLSSIHLASLLTSPWPGHQSHPIVGSQERICCASTASWTVQPSPQGFRMQFGSSGKGTWLGVGAASVGWGEKNPVFGFLGPNGGRCCGSAAPASLAFSSGAACPAGPAAAAEPELFSSSMAHFLMEQARTREQD